MPLCCIPPEKHRFCPDGVSVRGRFTDTGSNVVLTPEDIKLLKGLKGAGERGRTIHAFNTRVALQRLAKGGYVFARTADDGLVNYRIAKRGADAIAENE